MKNKHTKKILPLYFALLAADLIAIALGSKGAEYVFKPLLMIALAGYAYMHLKGLKTDNWLLAALGFSWLGDVILMNPNWFIFGLASFLIAHIFYILTFKQADFISVFKQSDRSAWAIVTVFFTGGLVAFLSRFLGPMLVPVGVYAGVITLMLLTMLNRLDYVSNGSFLFSMIGAILFAFSDSVIAINKFANPIPYAGFIIMLTYGIGQWLIVEGYLKQKAKK
jgi:uncharacterized membrane protein YhhN